MGIAEVAQLPILRGIVDKLPSSLDAIVCTSDLQGIDAAPQSGPGVRLLGELLAVELAAFLEVISVLPSRTGIVLAGDFYSSATANQRGASGDVRCVWDAFVQRFRWVAGVSGNHDRLGHTPDDVHAFVKTPNLHYLDGTVCSVDGLTLAGIGGIIGKPAKPMRRSAKDYASTLKRLEDTKPDLIIRHQSPDVEELAFLGSDKLTAAYGRQTYPLVICGHISWPSPFVQLSNGTQLLNVDSRAVILQSTSS